MKNSNRRQVSNADIERVCALVRDKLYERLVQKGRGAFASEHEAYGILMEEVGEVWLAVKSNEREQFEHEMVDTAVAAIFGLLSDSTEG